jgi:hypothetical protein
VHDADTPVRSECRCSLTNTMQNHCVPEPLLAAVSLAAAQARGVREECRDADVAVSQQATVKCEGRSVECMANAMQITDPCWRLQTRAAVPDARREEGSVLLGRTSTCSSASYLASCSCMMCASSGCSRGHGYLQRTMQQPHRAASRRFDGRGVGGNLNCHSCCGAQQGGKGLLLGGPTGAGQHPAHLMTPVTAVSASTPLKGSVTCRSAGGNLCNSTKTRGVGNCPAVGWAVVLWAALLATHRAKASKSA